MVPIEITSKNLYDKRAAMCVTDSAAGRRQVADCKHPVADANPPAV